MTDPKTIRPPAPFRRRVLVADDEEQLCRALGRALAAADFDVVQVHDGNLAIDAVARGSFDVILLDIKMPGKTGVDLIRAIREYDLDVPVVLMTGNPDIGDALDAIELGALQYLWKPFSLEAVVSVVERASRLHRLLALKRGTLQPEGDVGLGVSFERALDSMWMAYQPIVSVGEQRVMAYEALMRTTEPALPDPGAMLLAAERLDRLNDLGRRVRGLVASSIPSAPKDALVFVNLHTRDMLDPELASEKAPLSSFSTRVVLEITEQGTLDDVKDIRSRVERLRSMGFRVAIDDLGAGNAGLESIETLEPDFVKLDMSLVRGIHASEDLQNLVGTVVSLCRQLKNGIIAEGIEVGDERDQLRELGCDWMQGYLFARPSPPFPTAAWE